MKKTLLWTALLLIAEGVCAQTTDSLQAQLDSIDAKMKLLKLKEISVSAAKPIYSMTGEVVNYNVEDDPTVEGLTAFDAIRNAPTVSIDAEGNISMQGSDQVEVWLNGHPTQMNGPLLKVFFESMPASSIARVEVIKNPSAKYMVAEGHHIINVVTSTRVRVPQLLILGLSGNSRPYLSPWASYVRNTDRLKFNIHLAGSGSHGFSTGEGSYTLGEGADTASRRHYDYSSTSSRYFGSGSVGVSYQMDEQTDLHLMWWGLLQGDRGSSDAHLYEQWDYQPDTAHYQYLDSSTTHMAMHNGFVNFDIQHRFAEKGHNLRLGGTWNYLFSSNRLIDQRVIQLSEGNAAALLLEPYDRNTRYHRNRNTVDLSLTYNRPLDSTNTLTLRLGGRPYGNSHYDRTILHLDPASNLYQLPDTLRNLVCNSYTRQVSALASLRHEWERTTLTLDLFARQQWLTIANSGLFPDDTTLRYFCFEPSASLTHRTPSMHYLRLRYSTSVGIPSGDELSTTRQYGTDSYSEGRRGLRNSLTHSLNASWNRYYERFGNVGVEAYVNATQGGIESVTYATDGVDPYIGRIISYTMPVNIDGSYKTGVDGHLTYRPAAWINLRLGASLYRQGYCANAEWQERTSWKVDVGLWTKIAKRVNYTIDLNYGSPTIGYNFEQQYALTVSTGASATLLDGRLSINLYLNDIFDSNRYWQTVSSTSYSSSTSSHYSSRYLTFGISYRIGKMDLQFQAQEGAAGQ